MNLKERAKKLKMDIPVVFIALGKKETPILAKVLAGAAVAYALSPIDLIPDFIPVLGYIDDILLLPLLVSLAISRIPPHILAQCRIEAEDLWNEGSPSKWYFSLPVILIWLLVVFIIVKSIWL